MVSGSPFLRVPVGVDAHRWRTFPAERTLVVAARTVTSTVRVLESLPALLRDDPRVSVVFAHDPTSAFAAGVLDLLHTSGCRVMPWEQLAHVRADLVLTASENVDLPEGDCPVLVLPHGVGFQKRVPDARGPHDRLSGLVPDALLESGRAWLAVSHPDQERQLLAAHPKTAGRTLLLGDPCFDELLAGRRRRHAYREALGVAEGQRLVVVSSTWGTTSLLGRHPDLPVRLLGGLPHDEYRVAAVVHPNVWSAHGAWRIRALQSSALDAGLILLPPVHAWRSALVAADVVIGDHGSVTLYGAALGTPVLLGAFGADAVPGTAVHDLAAAAPRLDPDAELRAQVESTVREHTPERYAEVARRAFADPGSALARLRAAVYELLKLPEPVSAPPPDLLLPAPEPAARPVTSSLVVAEVSEEGHGPVVTVRRFPAAAYAHAQGDPDAGDTAHLACSDGERDRRLLESASVVERTCPADSAAEALRWIRATAAELPGSLLAACAVRGGGHLVGLRDGRVVEVSVTGAPIAPGLAAAVVYACLRQDRSPAEALLTLRVGEVRDEDVVLRLRPAPPVVS
ncbi:hypothetical protein [Streptomyces sp. Ag109_G2-15]|uniref:hypothetical protein n=1 Tax=Streptomyces sp. Ag109_G2-15 TaxID=1938850 RepID=UPI00211D034B|nr:hypothetical protein [Streptomyces sp. Ag109_G2-15]